MRLGRNDIGALMWLATAACLFVAFFGFAVVAPWTFSVMSVADAAARCPGTIDPSWPAVVCNHGQPFKWELGLIGDNPLRYGAALAQMIVGLIAWGYGVRRMKRFMQSP
jgi:hypothetical protein